MAKNNPYGINPDTLERERLRVKKLREKYRAQGKNKLPNRSAQFKAGGVTYTLSANKTHRHGLEVKVATQEAAKESRKRGKYREQIDDLTPEQETLRLQQFESARLLTDLTGTQHHVDHILAIENGGSSNNPENLQVLTDFHNLSKGTSTSGTAYDSAMLNGQRNGEFIRRYLALGLKASDQAQLIQLFAEMHGAAPGELEAANNETTSRMNKMSEIARKNGGINGMPDIGFTEQFFGRSFVQDERQDFKH